MAPRARIVASLPENLPEEHCAGLIARGIVPLYGIAEAMDAVEAAAFIGEAWAADASTVGAEALRLAPPDSCPPRGGEEERRRCTHSPPVGCGEVPWRSQRRSGGRSALDEAAAKAMLRAGRPFCAARHAALRPSTKPSRRPNALGFPVALKALGVAHKSEAGAVKLNLRDDDAVRAAARAAVGARHRPLCRAHGCRAASPN